MYLLVVLFPLIGSLVAGLLGRFIGARGSSLITLSFVALSFVLSCFAFYEVAICHSVCSVSVFHWFSSEMFLSEWCLYFDSLTVVMLIVITSISSLVHLYSIGYMSEDPHLPRFMSYLSIFTFFMLMLVTANNLLQMFFGWEGVGLASYLLINFWFTRLQANKSSIKAMLVNRVGDFGLALGIMATFFVFKTVEFPLLFQVVPYMRDSQILFCNTHFHALTLIAICLFIGAVGKSAQLGLHTWLPDAMEGPTPVSALIHAATMVTAGVFMIARCSPLFEYAPQGLFVVSVLGGMTCFFAATTALVQNDLKRVIAYSTCSQLGYMVFACGLSNYSVGVFHLMNHAFFKALLFLGAGSVIHSLANEQDMRKMGATRQLLPFTYASMVIGSLSLAGFPFLTGFYSKDVILELAYSHYTINGNFAYWLGALCVGLTAYYSFRLVVLSFFSESKTLQAFSRNCHDAPITMAVPLMILAVASIIVGYCAKDMMIGLATPFWQTSLFQLNENVSMVESEFLPQFVKLVPLFATLIGITLAFALHAIPSLPFLNKKANVSATTTSLPTKLYTMLNKRWFFDKLYNDFVSKPFIEFAYNVSFKRLDKAAFELFGPQGISFTLIRATDRLSKLQTGSIYHYALGMVIGCILFITCTTLWDFLSTLVDSRLYFLLFIAFILRLETIFRQNLA